MMRPAAPGPLLAVFAPVFTQPTYARFLSLAGAAILTTVRRTVANVLRTAGNLAPGHRTSYQRVPSAAEWSGLELGRTLARFLLDHVVLTARSTSPVTTPWTATRGRACTGRPGTAT